MRVSQWGVFATILFLVNWYLMRLYQLWYTNCKALPIADEAQLISGLMVSVCVQAKITFLLNIILFAFGTAFLICMVIEIFNKRKNEIPPKH